MTKLSEREDIKGLRPCEEQGISTAEKGLWCVVRNNATNAWICNANNGNVTTNNTYNRYRCVPSSELLSSFAARVLEAEAACYANKHQSKGSAALHYHLSSLVSLISQLKDGTWQPSRSILFAVSRPCYREIYCSPCIDRVVHHLVAPLLVEVAEYAHTKGGNVSHGNRKGYSVQTAAEQIRDNIYKASCGYSQPCYVMTYDISGFFMSIDRDKAIRLFIKYYDEMPKEVGRDDAFSIDMIRRALYDEPTLNAEIRGSQHLLDLVPVNKRLRAGKGLPIGKYLSQLMACLFLADVNEALAGIDGLYHTQFVDDACNVASDLQTLWEGYRTAKAMYESKGLTIHPKKLYIQPADRGVAFCGRVIKMQRIYISNRTHGYCIDVVREALRHPCLTNARKLCNSLNSYFGAFSHCAAYNIQRAIADKALEAYSEWLYIVYKPNHIVFRLKKIYTTVYQSITDFNDLINYYEYETCKDERRKSLRRCDRRNWRSSRKVQKRRLQASL